MERNRLGRGLSGLLGTRVMDTLRGAETHAPEASTRPQHASPSVPTDMVRPNPQQPRGMFSEASIAQLADSIRRHGVLQPVIVRRADDGQFELIAGERRWRAAKAAGLKEIPAVLMSADDRSSLEIALIENLQREDLNPLDRAMGYRKYLDTFGVSAEDLAARLGESRPNVVNYLRLLRLTPEVQEMVRRGDLAMGQARAISGVRDEQRQLAIARLAVSRNMSVRQVERLVSGPEQASGTDAGAEHRAVSRSRHIDDLERSFSQSIGLPVRVIPGRKKNSGRVVISYRTLDEFDLICQRLGVTITG